jgi:hypothetical protein
VGTHPNESWVVIGEIEQVISRFAVVDIASITCPLEDRDIFVAHRAQSLLFAYKNAKAFC